MQEVLKRFGNTGQACKGCFAPLRPTEDCQDAVDCSTNGHVSQAPRHTFSAFGLVLLLSLFMLLLPTPHSLMTVKRWWTKGPPSAEPVLHQNEDRYAHRLTALAPLALKQAHQASQFPDELMQEIPFDHMLTTDYETTDKGCRPIPTIGYHRRAQFKLYYIC